MSHPIYLTFDDGPNEPYTQQVLDVLAAHKAQATFFVCGQNIKRSPETLQKIVAAGHAIGCHSYSHNPWKVLTGNLFDETVQTLELIKQVTGIETNLYRSPWGITMPWLIPRLKKLGLTVYHWNIMAFDWWQPSAEFIATHLLARVSPGAIILLHDGDQLNMGSRARTVEALKILLPQLQIMGFETKTLNSKINNRQKRWQNMAKDVWAWLKLGLPRSSTL